MAKWEVNQWTQVVWDGAWLTGGDTFEADPEKVASEGLSQYVTPLPEEPVEADEPEEKPAKAKPAAPNKARKASPNK